MDTRPNMKSEALRVLWHMRNSQMLRHDMAYLLPNPDNIVSWADVVPWLKHLGQPCELGCGHPRRGIRNARGILQPR